MKVSLFLLNLFTLACVYANDSWVKKLNNCFYTCCQKDTCDAAKCTSPDGKGGFDCCADEKAWGEKQTCQQGWNTKPLGNLDLEVYTCVSSSGKQDNSKCTSPDMKGGFDCIVSRAYGEPMTCADGYHSKPLPKAGVEHEKHINKWQKHHFQKQCQHWDKHQENLWMKKKKFCTEPGANPHSCKKYFGKFHWCKMNAKHDMKCADWINGVKEDDLMSRKFACLPHKDEIDQHLISFGLPNPMSWPSLTQFVEKSVDKFAAEWKDGFWNQEDHRGTMPEKPHDHLLAGACKKWFKKVFWCKRHVKENKECAKWLDNVVSKVWKKKVKACKRHKGCVDSGLEPDDEIDWDDVDTDDCDGRECSDWKPGFWNEDEEVMYSKMKNKKQHKHHHHHHHAKHVIIPVAVGLVSFILGLFTNKLRRRCKKKTLDSVNDRSVYVANVTPPVLPAVLVASTVNQKMDFTLDDPEV